MKKRFTEEQELCSLWHDPNTSRATAATCRDAFEKLRFVKRSCPLSQPYFSKRASTKFLHNGTYPARLRFSNFLTFDQGTLELNHCAEPYARNFNNPKGHFFVKKEITTAPIIAIASTVMRTGTSVARSLGAALTMVTLAIRNDCNEYENFFQGLCESRRKSTRSTHANDPAFHTIE